MFTTPSEKLIKTSRNLSKTYSMHLGAIKNKIQNNQKKGRKVKINFRQTRGNGNHILLSYAEETPQNRPQNVHTFRHHFNSTSLTFLTICQLSFKQIKRTILKRNSWNCIEGKKNGPKTWPTCFTIKEKFLKKSRGKRYLAELWINSISIMANKKSTRFRPDIILVRIYIFVKDNVKTQHQQWVYDMKGIVSRYWGLYKRLEGSDWHRLRRKRHVKQV